MVDPNRLREELRRMKALINKDPKVKAYFDKDGNGVIDGEEWEQVRQLVVQRLERQEAEARAAQQLAAQSAAGGAAAAAPSEAQVEPVGAVATEILDQDLLVPLDPEPRAEAGGLAELILEQQGGLVGQAFEGMMRRTYTVYAKNGQVVADIEQVENQAIQNLTHKGFGVPDLHFRIRDHLSGQMLTLKRSDSFGDPERIGVLNAAGNEVAHTRFRGQLLEMEAMAYSSLQSLGLSVKRRMLKPWTYDIRTELGDVVGKMERGWSGLGGFLTGGNKMYVQVEPSRSSPELTWALVAAALLFDLNAEEKRDKDKGGGLLGSLLG